MSVHEAEKAGSWYPGSAAELAAELDKYIAAAADTPCEKNAVAAIVPHAGLAYSGPLAAKAFVALQCSTPETIVIFGAVHTMSLDQPAIWPRGEWKTPLGAVKVDEELAQIMIDKGVGEENISPHKGDNAIELQMPFIRHMFPEAKIVPIAVPPIIGIESCGTKVWDIIQQTGRSAVVVGSTDLTHYGISFAFTPAGTGQKALEWSKENDRRLIDLMLAGKAEDMVQQSIKDRSACGGGAAASTVAYANAAGACGKLLEHTTSYDVMPDGEPMHFVGYASLVFAL